MDAPASVVIYIRLAAGHLSMERTWTRREWKHPPRLSEYMHSYIKTDFRNTCMRIKTLGHNILENYHRPSREHRSVFPREYLPVSLEKWTGETPSGTAAINIIRDSHCRYSERLKSLQKVLAGVVKCIGRCMPTTYHTIDEGWTFPDIWNVKRLLNFCKYVQVTADFRMRIYWRQSLHLSYT